MKKAILSLMFLSACGMVLFMWADPMVGGWMEWFGLMLFWLPCVVLLAIFIEEAP